MKQKSWARLDVYEYDLDYDIDKDAWKISIGMQSNEDVDIADIATMVTANDNYIYIDGKYMVVDDMTTVYGNNDPVYLIILATELTQGEIK